MTQAYSSGNFRRVYAGDFPELQAHFLADLSAVRAQSALAPGLALVPGRLAALHLSRVLAWNGTSHANLRFQTLGDYARELADPLRAERGLRMLPDVARDPIMKRAIENCGRLHYFSRVAGRAGFRTAVWNTIHDLRAAGLIAPELLQVSTRSGMSEHLARKLSDIAAIWRSFDSLMERHKFADRATILELACEVVAHRSNDDELDDAMQPANLAIYGLDVLNSVERVFLGLLMRGTDTLAYLPFRASDAYAWSEPLYIWYLEQGFEAELLEPEQRANHGNVLSRVQTGLFEDLPASSTANVEQGSDQSFRVISAPTRDAEVEEILREILFPSAQVAEETIARCGRRAVLMRDSTNYLDLFRDEWQRAEIRSYFHVQRRLGDTPAGHALRNLVALLEGQFRRADVMEFLLSAPLRQTDTASAGSTDISAAEWNYLSLEAQIIAGETAWADHLGRLRNHLEAELTRREWEADDPASPVKRQLASLTTLEACLQRLFAGVKTVHAALSWQQLGERLTALYTSFVEPDGNADLICARLRDAALLDSFGTIPTSEEVAAFVDSILSQPLQRDSKFQMHDPAVATIADTLGVVFDDVFLCGLVEKEFPRNTSQDPLLLDDERRQLQKALSGSHPGVDIPLHGRRHLREKFLFRVAVNSARQRVVLSYPRMDPSEGREWLASAFLLRAVEAATRTPADYESFDTYIRTSPQAHRVPVNRLLGHDAKRAVNAFEYDLARLGEALSSRSEDGSQAADLVADLFAEDEFFRRSLQAERSRYRERQFTPFDGAIESDSLRRRLPEWIPRLSPARIASYLRCPFQYFAAHMLELDPIVEPRWSRPPAPRARGQLAQDILESFYRRESESGHLPLQEDAWPRLEQVAREHFSVFEREQLPGLFLLWDVERQRLLRRLRTWYQFERRDPANFARRHFDVTIGMEAGDPVLSRAAPVTVTLGNGFILQLRGRLDRIDVDDSGHARGVDYSTSDYESQRKKSQKRDIETYAFWRTAEALGLQVASVEHLYLGVEDVKESKIDRAEFETLRAQVEMVIGSVAEQIASGHLFPFPSDCCSTCPARSACGSGRFTRKWEFESPQIESLRILLQGES